MHDFTISLSTKGSQIIKRFVKSLRVLHLKMPLVFSLSFLPSESKAVRERRTAACHTAATQLLVRVSPVWFPLLLGEIGGNDRADGARDITNLIMNSLSFGLDTLFLFISWYLSLVCVHFVFITAAHVKAERGSVDICWICSLVACSKLISEERCL